MIVLGESYHRVRADGATWAAASLVPSFVTMAIDAAHLAHSTPAPGS